MQQEPIALRSDQITAELVTTLQGIAKESTGDRAAAASRLAEALAQTMDAGRQTEGPMAVLAGRAHWANTCSNYLTPVGWKTAGGYSMAHPDLLTDEADALIERLLAVETRPQARQLVQTWQQVLRRCREVGIETAFAEVEATQRMPPELREVLEALAAEGVEIQLARGYLA